MIERAVVLSTGLQITLEELPGIVETGARTPSEEQNRFYYATAAFRREMIQSALARANGNHAEAARAPWRRRERTSGT